MQVSIKITNANRLFIGHDHIWCFQIDRTVFCISKMYFSISKSRTDSPSWVCCWSIIWHSFWDETRWFSRRIQSGYCLFTRHPCKFQQRNISRKPRERTNTFQNKFPNTSIKIILSKHSAPLQSLVHTSRCYENINMLHGASPCDSSIICVPKSHSQCCFSFILHNNEF